MFYIIYILLTYYVIQIQTFYEINKDWFYKAYAILLVVPGIIYMMIYSIKKALDYRKGRKSEEEIYNKIQEIKKEINIDNIEIKKNVKIGTRDIDILIENNGMLIAISVKTTPNKNSEKAEYAYFKYLYRTLKNIDIFILVYTNVKKSFIRKVHNKMLIISKDNLGSIIKDRLARSKVHKIENKGN